MNNPNDDPRVIVVMKKDLLAALEDERKRAAGDIPSRSELIRDLLQEALNLRTNQRKQRRL